MSIANTTDTILTPGTRAPDFILHSAPGQTISLAKLRGQTAILAFDLADWSHAAFARERRIKCPVLADFEPKDEVARTYGAYRNAEEISERALFVIDGGRTIRWSYLSSIGVNPGSDGIRTALEALPAKGTKQ